MDRRQHIWAFFTAHGATQRYVFLPDGGARRSLVPPFFTIVSYSACKRRLSAIGEIERFKQERKKNKRTMRIAAVLMCISAAGLVFMMYSNFITSYKIQNRLYMEEKAIAHESSETTVVELCVVDKRIEFYGFTGILNKYALVLSNDMVVYVKKSDFSKYEKDQFYNFTVTETTTVSQWITVK